MYWIILLNLLDDSVVLNPSALNVQVLQNNISQIMGFLMISTK